MLLHAQRYSLMYFELNRKQNNFCMTCGEAVPCCVEHQAVLIFYCCAVLNRTLSMPLLDPACPSLSCYAPPFRVAIQALF